MIDEELLAILACPGCQGDVALRDGQIVCLQCGRRYPIREGVPIMLVDEAQVPRENL
mgnify:CR=1 FL=1